MYDLLPLSVFMTVQRVWDTELHVWVKIEGMGFEFVKGKKKKEFGMFTENCLNSVAWYYYYDTY